ncbi:MAG: GntR family transcriptional regulator [Planctomycetes bacterium]|nr:GntR family transcriptional regulator [Planctomycetota bacterium]MBU4398921.1 GntR family transcriptional regulator [Planctomycetota bacterium]MCG2682273.1 GntR family transcriptional regulator [Planctomycetales bacterium]
MADIAENKVKHRRIFEKIEAGIRSGRYVAGQRLPSEAQLVRQFNASRPTVARAMRDLETAGLVCRRAGSGSYVQALAEPRNRTLGLLIQGLGETEIFEPICGEIARRVHAHGFSLLWGDCVPRDLHGKIGQLKDVCQNYIDHKVAGVFFAPLSRCSQNDGEINLQTAEALDRAGIQVVLLDRDFEEFPNRSKYDLVGVDNRQAGYLLAKHLLELGCRRIDFISHPLVAFSVRERIAGYCDALFDHGVQVQPEWIWRGDVEDDAFAEQVMADTAEAYVCANDLTAGHLMQRLLAKGIRVPQDVRVVGVDDVKYARLLPVPLTTARQPCRDIGTVAVATMMQRIADLTLPTRRIQLPCQLVIRQSCGAEQGAAAENARVDPGRVPIRPAWPIHAGRSTGARIQSN